MYKNKKISVVIPTYKVSKHIKEVVSTLPKFVDNIIAVDDKCPQNSADIVKNMEKVIIVYHEVNQGVGGQ